MTDTHEATEILRIFFGIFAWIWPFARIGFIVWATLSVTRSLSQIARNLERVVNRWDLEREAHHRPTKGTPLEPDLPA